MNSTELEKTRLTSSTVKDFFKRRLRWKTLSIIISEIIDLDSGYFYSFLPPKLEGLEDFDKSLIMILGLDPKTAPKEQLSENVFQYADYLPQVQMVKLADEMLVHMLSEKFVEFDNSVFIAEDRMASTSDLNLAKNKRVRPLYCTFGEEIYYTITNKARFNQNLVEIFNEVSYSFFFGILTRSDDISFTQTKQIDLEHLKRLAHEVRLIVVGAFDDEGVIFWEKDET
jgi:hypothetical protein